MAATSSDIDALIARIDAHEAELARLKSEFAEALQKQEAQIPNSSEPVLEDGQFKKRTLKPEEYQRYGRQMILPEVGLQGQLTLRSSSALIIGLGGLGCPAAAYLAGAGIGTLGLADGDTVELSNLHRQILHTTGRIGSPKVESAVQQLRQMNPTIKYKTHPHLTPALAPSLFAKYDLILDCTDHPTSRYLISDAAVLAGVPLVSASALKTEGQLLVLNNPPRTPAHPGGPCYRCVFPRPPAPETVVGCGEGGILGPVVGVMGVLMAVEGVKVLTGRARAAAGSGETAGGTGDESAGEIKPEPFSMLIYSAYSEVMFRTLRMKGKRRDCVACSERPSISVESLVSGSLDYAVFCGVAGQVGILGEGERVSAREYAEERESGRAQVLVDVRDETQFGICSLEGSINIPFHLIESASVSKESNGASEGSFPALHRALGELPSHGRLYTVCRFGNDSQIAVQKLRALGLDREGQRWIGDISGGFQAWKNQVDPSWPEY